MTDNKHPPAKPVVTVDLEPNGVYVGDPARFVKKIEENDPLLDEIT